MPLNKEFLSVTEVSKLLGVSRVTIHNRIKRGDIPATRVGKIFLIPAGPLAEVLHRGLTESDKSELKDVLKRVMDEYGETLRKLGDE